MAIATPALSTLVSLLVACDLIDAVNDSSANLTVFGPTNEAFTKFFKGKALPKTCCPEVKKILTYHVSKTKFAVKADDPIFDGFGGSVNLETLAGKTDQLFIK